MFLRFALAEGLLDVVFGWGWGQFICGVGVVALVCSRPKFRYELPLQFLHRKRLRKTQRTVDWALEDKSPQLCRLGTSPIGEVMTASVMFGTSVADLERKAPVLAAALRAREVRIRQHREDASLFDMLVVRTETLERPVEPAGFLARYRPNLYSCVPLGIDEDGNDVVVGLVGHHLLIGGEPGGGKSATLSVVLAAAARDPQCDIWCFDGKLVELAAWRPVAKRIIGADIDEAIAALDELRAEMDERYAKLLQRKRRKVERGDGERTLLVVIDELAFYVAYADKKKAQAFSERLRDLVARARAAGIVVVAATQKPSVDLIPSALRDNFGYRLAHRCSTKEASDTILGSGWSAEDVSASTIDPRLRGVGFLIADGGVPRRIRTMHLDDATIASVVAEAAKVERSRWT
jgi:hypothetical protein